MIEHFDILLTGVVSLKSLLLLLLVPAKTAVENRNTKMLIDNVMSKYPNYKNNPDVADMIHFIYNDGFKDETYINQSNISYLFDLKMLKDTFTAFYFKSLDEVKDDYEKVCDLHSRIGRFGLQISRLRMVIEPEVTISNNVHSVSKNEYLIGKSYWLNEEGKKIRKFTKLIGRLDEYPGGRTSEKAITDATLKLQEVMYQYYNETYK